MTALPAAAELMRADGSELASFSRRARSLASSTKSGLSSAAPCGAITVAIFSFLQDFQQRRDLIHRASLSCPREPTRASLHRASSRMRLADQRIPDTSGPERKLSFATGAFGNSRAAGPFGAPRSQRSKGSGIRNETKERRQPPSHHRNRKSASPVHDKDGRAPA